MSDSLNTLYRDALRQSARPGLSEQARTRIKNLWQQVHAGVDVLEPANFGPFLATHVRDCYEATAPKDRGRELCSEGSHLCAVLRGRLPDDLNSRRQGPEAVLRPRDGREYVQNNPDCHAVRTGVEAWDRERRETERCLQQIILASSERPGPDIDVDNIPGAEREPTAADGGTDR